MKRSRCEFPICIGIFSSNLSKALWPVQPFNNDSGRFPNAVNLSCHIFGRTLTIMIGQKLLTISEFLIMMQWIGIPSGNGGPNDKEIGRSKQTVGGEHKHHIYLIVPINLCVEWKAGRIRRNIFSDYQGARLVFSYWTGERRGRTPHHTTHASLM